ncbi:MAG: FKBP-type peptidyl-prolyl cis-trans isomerase, partial [Ginsengibacter sp.]
MNRTFYLLVLAAFIGAGCSDTGYKKSLNGLEYRIMKGNGGQPIKIGNTVKFTVIGYYKDSALTSGYDSIPQLLAIDSNNLPPAYVKIFTEAKTGDSIVTRIMVDSVMKQTPQLPPFAKKGEYFSTHIKLIDVYTDTATINREKTAFMKTVTRLDSTKRIEQKQKDDKVLTDYIASNHLTTVKTAKGTYAVIENPGQGEAIDSGKAVSVNYTGMTLQGKVFDKSYDSSGKPTKPYTFIIGQRGAIEGWDDGIRLFKKGGKGKLLIPSSLAYGPRGAGADIKPNESLLFQIEVVDVSSGEAYRKQMEAQSKAMQQLQQMQQQRNGQQPQ